jgi:hypothetical protein
MSMAEHRAFAIRMVEESRHEDDLRTSEPGPMTPVPPQYDRVRAGSSHG